ncbi:MAG: hypothetical protein JXA25_14310 [Anaerolineales bacterium]|nr:hypothetical protein [Anaerolineales bacterium]
MEYLNIGSVFVGILLILGFFNADAIFREPALSDPFEDDLEDNTDQQAARSSLLEPSKMFTREILAELADELGLPVAELHRRFDNKDGLEDIAKSSGLSEMGARAVVKKYGINGDGYLQ